MTEEFKENYKEQIDIAKLRYGFPGASDSGLSLATAITSV